MADAVEALGQHVYQETPDELLRVKSHRLPAVRTVDAIILPAERDAGVVSCNEAAVRDSDPMGVTGEIAQNLLGSCERRLAIDHPVGAPQRWARRLNAERYEIGAFVELAERLWRYPRDPVPPLKQSLRAATLRIALGRSGRSQAHR